MLIRILQFKTDYPTGGREPVDKVLIAPIGEDFERTQTWRRVEKIRPPADADQQMRESPTFIDMAAKWQVIGPAYEAWKQGNELPEDGTPLGAWSGVNMQQAEMLKNMGVRTVEEVASLGDGALAKLQIPNARKLPALAKKWLEGEAVSTKDAKIDDLEERLRIMQEMLEEQRQAADNPKRGPGRPPKVKADENEGEAA